VIIINQKKLGCDVMTDRKWRIIESNDRIRFYGKIDEYEKLGYELLPESLGHEKGVGYFALMKNEKFS
jgi:hypothetical protein